MDVKVIIIAGGIGTRLWPVSTPTTPKQFCKLTSKDKSLIQLTYERALGITTEQNIYVNTNQRYSEIVMDQLPISSNNILYEPNGKNTGPIICLIANYFYKQNPDSVLVFLWADHHYNDDVDTVSYMNTAIESARHNEVLHTIGILPTHPHTGLGYIKKADQIADNLYKVDAFKEKPDLNTAIEYLKEGKYLWNSGTYIAKAKVFIDEFSKSDPHTLNIVKNLDINEIDIDLWNKLENISIDYAIAEKAKEIIVVEAGLIWSDVGTWPEYEGISPIIDENTIINGNFKQIDSKNNIIYTDNKSIIGLIDINDSIVIKSGNKVLISSKKSITKLNDLRKLMDDKYLS